MPGTAVTQPNYTDNGQTGSVYPTAIDAITQAMARIAAAFNPHAVPAAAAAPALTSSAGGSLGARTYYSKITLVTPAGEVAPSAESNLALVANTLLNVASPTFALGITGWNVYVGTASGTETKQNASPIAIGTAWVEPTGGLISGAALPAGLSPMAVIVDAGVIPASGALATEVAAQLTAAITAPTTNPRKDIVYIDATTGAVGIATGTEAAPPVDPAVPAGKVAVARINCTVGMTAIANSMIDDLRNLQLLGLGDSPVIFSKTFALSGVLSPSQITANQNDYNPTNLSTANTLRLSSDAARDITGLQGGATGRLLVIHNVGSNNIVLKDESASSSAANRFALTGDLTLAADQIAWLHYDSTSSRWRVVSSNAASFATSAEVKTGTVANKSIAPDALLAALGFSAYYNSGNQTITSAGPLTLAHGLGRKPVLVNAWLKCLTAESIFSVGDELLVTNEMSDSGTDNRGYVLRRDATNLRVRFGAAATNFITYNDSGAWTGLTNANWAIIFEAFA